MGTILAIVKKEKARSSNEASFLVFAKAINLELYFWH